MKKLIQQLLRVIYYIFYYFTFSAFGEACERDNIGSSGILVLPIPRTLTSFTMILRSGMVKPNSVLYLNLKKKHKYIFIKICLY